MRERDIFIDALEKGDPSDRAAYLDQTCLADSGLRDRVEQLLAEHQREDSFFLDGPPAGLDTTAEEPISERPGTLIGPYKLLQQIGEGGFGVVFMAEQSQPFQRTVAIKIIKPGMDTKQVIARFEAERQALALMDHPNIARVLDAGTTESGRPYFVMELVKGIPITKYCDEKRLSIQARLELMLQVCQSVQHAHQKGIIHRDIKPTNVLVAEYDHQAVPKVIDFGVAKATAQRLTDRTMFTEFGQVLGTMEYMSPEQAKFNQLDIDTRSDIYSLGVLLYELLTGSTPFARKRLQDAAFDEMLRIIREEEPPTPSTRLGTTADLQSVAANRGAEPSRLSGLVKGDLDWVVMKALDKDRNRRYETANGLAADIRRYLDDEPVLACPPSPLYRFRKFARRNKAALVMASLVSAALLLTVAGLAVSTVLIAREQRTTSNALKTATLAKDNLEQALDRERRDSYFHRITLAHRELSVNNLGRTLQLLEECPEDLREWEWNYLMRLCRVEPLVIHDTTEVNSIAFSPDGASLAAANGDGTIKVWDTKSGKVTDSFAAHPGFASSVVFHPDGRHLASVGADSVGANQRVKVWDLATDSAVFTEQCDVMHVYGTAYAVAFSPDGSSLAAGNNGAINIWDWQEHQLSESFPGSENRRISVAFDRGGERLASGNWWGNVQLWNLKAGDKPLCKFTESSETRHPVCALAFSPDSQRLATASFHRRVDLWDTATGGLMRTLVHSGLALCVAYSPDGRRLASAGEDKTVHLWDATTGREVLGLFGHTSNVGCVVFSPDGRRLASASTDKTIRIWDATPLEGHEGLETLTFREHSDEIWSLAVSPDGQKIVSAGFSPSAMVWDPQTGRVISKYSGHQDVVFHVAWHPDGRQIASAGADHGGLFTVKVWNALTGHEDFALPAGPEYFCAAFSPDGRYLVTGQANRMVRVWDARTGDEIGTLGSHDRVMRGVAFSADGRHLVSASADGVVKLWDGTRLTEHQEARHSLQARVHGPTLNVAFSPDGKRLATGGDENTVMLWDVETGEELRTMRGHNGDIYTVAFSPDSDGRWVASAGEDSAVNIWDSHTGKLMRSFRGHTALVTCVDFSRDGKRLYSGSRDHTVKVWDLAELEDAAANQ